MTLLTTSPKRWLALPLAIGTLLTLPIAAQAATTFGSRLTNEPANSGECESLPDPCTLASFIHPSDPDGDPYAGGAPVDGVITKFRIRGHGGGDGGGGTLAADVTFLLVDINRPNPSDESNALATVAGIGSSVTIPASTEIDTPILEFPGQLPVKQGQHLAINGTNIHATVNNSGDEYSYLYTPPLVEGQGARGSTDSTGELLVQADIEPDADGDGAGDETQDQCPSQAGTAGVCDNGPPAFSAVSTSGGKIFYRLSEAAKVTVKAKKQKKGRKVRGKCRKPNKNNRSKPKCKRFVKVRGTLSDNGVAGLNDLVFNGRIGGRKLGAGRYKLILTAIDTAGNKSTKTIEFRVRKRKRR